LYDHLLPATKDLLNGGTLARSARVSPALLTIATRTSSAIAIPSVAATSTSIRTLGPFGSLPSFAAFSRPIIVVRSAVIVASGSPLLSATFAIVIAAASLAASASLTTRRRIVVANHGRFVIGIVVGLVDVGSTSLQFKRLFRGQHVVFVVSRKAGERIVLFIPRLTRLMVDQWFVQPQRFGVIVGINRLVDVVGIEGILGDGVVCRLVIVLIFFIFVAEKSAAEVISGGVRSPVDSVGAERRGFIVVVFFFEESHAEPFVGLNGLIVDWRGRGVGLDGGGSIFVAEFLVVLDAVVFDVGQSGPRWDLMNRSLRSGLVRGSVFTFAATSSSATSPSTATPLSVASIAVVAVLMGRWLGGFDIVNRFDDRFMLFPQRFVVGRDPVAIVRVRVSAATGFFARR
jgi:hypothetical protein